MNNHRLPPRAFRKMTGVEFRVGELVPVTLALDLLVDDVFCSTDEKYQDWAMAHFGCWGGGWIIW